MAALGIEAIKKFADTGEKPSPTEGKTFVDTGVNLVTAKPARASNPSTSRKAWPSAGVEVAAFWVKTKTKVPRDGFARLAAPSADPWGGDLHE